MRSKSLRGWAVLLVTAATLAGRPVSAQNGSLNLVTSDCYCNVKQAVTGFCCHVQQLGAEGYLTAAMVNCLCAYALAVEGNLQAGSISASLAKTQFLTLMSQLLALQGGGSLPLGHALTPLSVPLSPAGVYPYISTCFINLNCPIVDHEATDQGLLAYILDCNEPGETDAVAVAIQHVATTKTTLSALQSPACEFIRRWVAEVMANDVFSMAFLAAAGAVTSPTTCTCADPPVPGPVVSLPG